MALTARDFDGVVRKLAMKERKSGHRFVYLEHDGKQVIWTLRSHGRGDLGRVENTIRRQLSVSKSQLRDLVACPMTRDAYIEHLKSLQIIGPSE